MKEKKSLPSNEKGVGLIVIIMVLSFLLTVGIVLVTVTSTGPRVAGNIRHQQEAFNAAEAGLDESLKSLSDQGVMDFASLYRTTFNGQPGLDDPTSTNYFRKLSDSQLVQDVLSQGGADSYLFASEPLPNDSRLAFTAFLIDDEAGVGTLNAKDVLLVCIGQAPDDSFVRLEVLIEIE